MISFECPSVFEDRVRRETALPLRKWIVLVVVPGIAKIHARAELARFGQLGEFGRNRALTCGKIRRASVVVNSSFGVRPTPPRGLIGRRDHVLKSPPS